MRKTKSAVNRMCACYSFYTKLYMLISAKTCFTMKTTAQAARIIASGYEAPFSRCCVCGGGGEGGGATPPKFPAAMFVCSTVVVRSFHPLISLNAVVIWGF